MIDYIKVYCGIPILVTAYDSKLILFRSIAIKLLEKMVLKLTKQVYQLKTSSLAIVGLILLMNQQNNGETLK